MTRPLDDPAMEELIRLLSYKGFTLRQARNALEHLGPHQTTDFFVSKSKFTRAEIELALAHLAVTGDLP